MGIPASTTGSGDPVSPSFGERHPVYTRRRPHDWHARHTAPSSAQESVVARQGRTISAEEDDDANAGKHSHAVSYFTRICCFVLSANIKMVC